MSAAGQLWELTIQKRKGDQYWTNVYHVVSTTMLGARDLGLYAWGVFERPFSQNDVVGESVRVRQFPGKHEGTVFPIGEFGNYGSGPYLPMFNVVRVDFPATSGRPSRKFYRFPLAEGDQTNGNLEGQYLALWATQIASIKSQPQFASFVDVDGQLLTDIKVYPLVGNRQLRRGSKRKVIG